MTEDEWLRFRDRFGENAELAGHCTCGCRMQEDEYSYYGGTFGYYICRDCAQAWTVDINGAMWPSAEVPWR